MSEALTIEGHTYTPLEEAAQLCGYSKQYLLIHIREGKFEAQKVGNHWYVNIDSAQAHYTSAKEKRKATYDTMREERQREYREQKTRETPHHTALIETLAIVMIGITLGGTGYLSTITPSPLTAHTSFMENLALTLYTTLTPQTAETLDALRLPTTTPEAPSSLVLLPASTTEARAREIASSFSDPVTITSDPVNPDMGVITPVFREGKVGEEFRFLMVPVVRE